MLWSSKDASQNASNQARMCRRCQESDEAKESRSLIEATTTITGYPAAVELLGPRPRPKTECHGGGVRARLSITPNYCGKEEGNVVVCCVKRMQKSLA